MSKELMFIKMKREVELMGECVELVIRGNGVVERV